MMNFVTNIDQPVHHLGRCMAADCMSTMCSFYKARLPKPDDCFVADIPSCNGCGCSPHFHKLLAISIGSVFYCVKDLEEPLERLPTWQRNVRVDSSTSTDHDDLSTETATNMRWIYCTPNEPEYYPSNKKVRRASAASSSAGYRSAPSTAADSLTDHVDRLTSTSSKRVL